MLVTTIIGSKRSDNGNVVYTAYLVLAFLLFFSHYLMVGIAFDLNPFALSLSRREVIINSIITGVTTTSSAATSVAIPLDVTDGATKLKDESTPRTITTATATVSSSKSNSKSFHLLSMIPLMEPFGAPATNATLSKDVWMKIEQEAFELEQESSSRNNNNNDINHNNNMMQNQNQSSNLASSSLLSGSWRLLYSNGIEITQLATGLPLGFALGKTYQPLDTATNRFENRGNVMNKYNLAQLQTNVIGEINISKPDTVNAVGVINDKGNRVDVNFKIISFEVDEILGIKLQKPIRKILVPINDPNSAQPANDITYLDETTRIVRGGDGALFIFRREESNAPMLTIKERDDIILSTRNKDNTNSGTVVIGNTNGNGNGNEVDRSKDTVPELKFLLKD